MDTGETRKDLARPSDPPSTRFVQGALNRRIVDQLTKLLSDEHALRSRAALMTRLILKLCSRRQDTSRLWLDRLRDII